MSEWLLVRLVYFYTFGNLFSESFNHSTTKAFSNLEH